MAKTSTANGHDVGHDWEDDTSPDAPQAMTNAAILREVRRLSRSVDALAPLPAAVADLSRVIEERLPAPTPPQPRRRPLRWVLTGTGAVLVLALVWWWSRK